MRGSSDEATKGQSDVGTHANPDGWASSLGFDGGWRAANGGRRNCTFRSAERELRIAEGAFSLQKVHVARTPTDKTGIQRQPDVTDR